MASTDLARAVFGRTRELSVLEAARGSGRWGLVTSSSLDNNLACWSRPSVQRVFLLLEGTVPRDGGRGIAFAERFERLQVSCTISAE